MEYLCKCNKCNSTLIDENPQVGAKKHELKGLELNMVKSTLGSDLVPFWACPNCLTDEYLTDI